MPILRRSPFVGLSLCAMLPSRTLCLGWRGYACQARWCWAGFIKQGLLGGVSSVWLARWCVSRMLSQRMLGAIRPMVGARLARLVRPKLGQVWCHGEAIAFCKHPNLAVRYLAWCVVRICGGSPTFIAGARLRHIPKYKGGGVPPIMRANGVWASTCRLLRWLVWHAHTTRPWFEERRILTCILVPLEHFVAMARFVVLGMFLSSLANLQKSRV